MTDQPLPLVRAGYWRRTLGVIVDWLIIGVPFSIAAAVIFNTSGGTWQGGSVVFNMTQCVNVQQVPGDLSPPPPRDSNFARICSVSSGFGQTAHALTVGRTDKSPGRISTVSRSYSLDSADRVIDAHDITWVFYLLILIYVVTLQHGSGQTLGQRVFRTRIIESQDLTRHGVGIARLAKRYGLLVGVYLLPVPFLVLAINAAASAEDGFSGWFSPVMALTALVWSVWSIWNLALVVRRRPTVYDRFAGLDVVHVNPPGGSPLPA